MPDVRSGLESSDFHLINKMPDPDFSPERNKAIIDDSIRKTNEFFSKEGKAVNDIQKERIDIVATYGAYRFNRGTKDFISYFGRENYHKLIGEKIMQKVRIAETVNKLNGNTRFKKGILL